MDMKVTRNLRVTVINISIGYMFLHFIIKSASHDLPNMEYILERCDMFLEYTRFFIRKQAMV